MVDRDYRADMDEVLRLKVPASNFIPAVTAAEVVAWLRANDPDLLAGWLDVVAVPIITERISRHLRAERSRAGASARARAFSEAADMFETSGDRSVFDTLHPVNDSNLRKRVRDMTRNDHLYVADQYQMTEHTARLEAAFHRAIAKQIPPGSTTEDVMDEITYLRLHESITRQ